MAKLYRLDRPQRQPRSTFFNRSELSQLLSLYSRRVASGEWRDYAIDQAGDVARFSVFRHTLERPAFTIIKRAGGPEYLVTSGPRRLKRARSLREALSVFEPPLSVVS